MKYEFFAVGDNFGLGTSASNNTPNGSPLHAQVPYAIRAIGDKFQYYFKVNLCC